MIRRKHEITALIAVLCLIIGFMTYAYIFLGKSQEAKTEVSVIVRGSNAERWENFRQGVQQAALDLNAEVTFVTMGDDDPAEKQISLIEKATAGNAKGLIISAVDSYLIAEKTQEAARHIPVVMAETNIFTDTGPEVTYISADNRQMGEKLARLIMKDNESETPVYIMKVGQQRESVISRQERLVEILEANGYTITYWELGEGDFSYSLFVEKMLQQSVLGVVVSLDEAALESVIDGAQDYMKGDTKSHQKENQQPIIYGIGSTAKIVYHLNQGMIQGIVFQDEYLMGYTSMERLLNQMHNGEKPGAQGRVIESYTTDRQTLHLQENERLLYPIIQ